MTDLAPAKEAPMPTQTRRTTTPREPVVTVDGAAVVIQIRGQFSTQEATEIAAAIKRAIDFASRHSSNFYTPSDRPQEA